MRKHSPGPWRAVLYEKPDALIEDARGNEIAKAYFDVEERDANARLIAAAPELAGELRTQLEFLDGIAMGMAARDPEFYGSPVEETIDDRRRSIRALLARIDGE